MTDDSAAALVPVFVDSSGRRARLMGLLGLATALVCALYLLLVGVALVAPPGVLPLTVPGLGSLLAGPGAPQLSDTAWRALRPAAVSPSSASSPASPADGTVVVPGSSPLPRASAARVVVASPMPRPGAMPTRTPATVVRPTSAPSAVPPAKPAALARRTGKPTAPPGAIPHRTGRP